MPGTPLLLAGIDLGEPRTVSQLRRTTEAELRRSPEWTVVLPPAGAGGGPGDLPALLSLGGLGVARGVRIPAAGSAREAVVTGMDLLDADELESAVTELRSSAPAAAHAAADLALGVVVAVLAALDAGVHVRVRTTAADTPVTLPLLVPLDFSGAAHADAPLAPVEGAQAFDAQLECALAGPVDPTELRRLAGRAEGFAAWTSGLLSALTVLERVDRGGGALSSGLIGTGLAATDAHHVRYRLVRLDARAGASSSGGCA